MASLDLLEVAFDRLDSRDEAPVAETAGAAAAGVLPACTGAPRGRAPSSIENHLGLAHDDRPFDDVLQLSNVTRTVRLRGQASVFWLMRRSSPARRA